MVSNYGEFAIIKIGIVNFLPNTDKFKRVPIAQPICNKKIPVFGTQHIRQAYVVLPIDLNHIYFGVFYRDFCHFCSIH